MRSFGFIDSDVRNISADILKDIKKEELIEFYKMMIKQPKITLRIVGNDDKKFDGSFHLNNCHGLGKHIHSNF